MINDGTYEFGDPTVMWLHMPPDSWVTVTTGGVVDKSRAFAPTCPQFVMRNSDLVVLDNYEIMLMKFSHNRK